MFEKYTRRDYLARDRTHLANERTLLAYLRTSAAFFIAGAFLFKFNPTENSIITGYFSISVGIVLFGFGTARFIYFRKKINNR